MAYFIYNGQLYRSDELYHHGIKGQKWGVRRFQNADGSLTPAGRKRYSASNKTDPSNDRDHSKSNKSELAETLSMLGFGLITLNPLVVGVETARLAQAGAAKVKKGIYDKDRDKCVVDKETGLLLKSREMTQKEDAARVNPQFHNFDKNTKNNCMLCTSAYDLRRRGYEVEAKKASVGYFDNDIKAWYPKAKIEKIEDSEAKYKYRPMNEKMMKQVKNTLISQGDGARGNLMITWANTFSGHSVAYEVTNGALTLVDAQSGKVYKDPDKLLRRCSKSLTYARLDNVKFNKKTIREVAG